MIQENRSTDGKTVTLTDEHGNITNTFQKLDTFILNRNGRKSKFTKELHTYENSQGETKSEMHLIGARGTRYVLNPWNSNHPLDKEYKGALYYAVSYTGGIMKKEGNTVVFFMIGGEFSFHRYA